MSSEFSRFSLFKRHNGLYSILYYHHGHRRWKATHVSTKSDALAVLSEFRELMSSRFPPVRWQDFMTRFLSYAESTYSQRTVELYRRVLLRFSRLVGNLFLAELTPEHFDAYKAQRLKDKYAAERLRKGSKERRLRSVRFDPV